MSLDADMRLRLAALEPSLIEIEDDSGLHVGHAGAKEGGHYRLTVVSARFSGQSRVTRHRMVYEALGPLMQRGIHALALQALAPEEH